MCVIVDANACMCGIVGVYVCKFMLVHVWFIVRLCVFRVCICKCVCLWFMNASFCLCKCVSICNIRLCS